MKTSNHLPDFKYEGQPINVEIITTNANTTAYHIHQTQGAEYGAEAEKMRKLFQAAPDLLAALKAANQMLNTHFGITDEDEGGNEIHDEIRLAIKSATHE